MQGTYHFDIGTYKSKTEHFMRNSCVSMGANQNNQVQMRLQIKDEKFV